MIILLIISWFILGYIGLGLVERILKTKFPTIFIMFGPLNIFLVLLLSFLIYLDDSDKTPSKLRKRIRGF